MESHPFDGPTPHLALRLQFLQPDWFHRALKWTKIITAAKMNSSDSFSRSLGCPEKAVLSPRKGVAGMARIECIGCIARIACAHLFKHGLIDSQSSRPRATRHRFLQREPR